MNQYVGILDGCGKTCGVRIPDLPGRYGAGRSPEAALADVISATREFDRAQAIVRRGVPVQFQLWARISGRNRSRRARCCGTMGGCRTSE